MACFHMIHKYGIFNFRAVTNNNYALTTLGKWYLSTKKPN